MNELISRAAFIEAVSEGIPINTSGYSDCITFGDSLIDWINKSDNEYWAAWDPVAPGQIVFDIKNMELFHTVINPGLLEFRRSPGFDEDYAAKEFGNGVVGVMLFCMLNSGQIEEVPLEDEDEPQVTKNNEPPATEDKRPPPDFSWI